MAPTELEACDNTAVQVRRPVYFAVKRTFDIAVSAAAILVTSPVLLAAAILVKFGSSGPILFRQERVGRNFRRFKILKFRTMVIDAPTLGAQITAGADPRITPIGRFLRKWKIDELPQLFNVLKGDMSLVGPRPEVPKYVEMFQEDYREILTVRPGITDPASIKYRDEAGLLSTAQDPERMYREEVLPDKIAIARQYVQSPCLRGDLRILAQTIMTVVS